MTKLTAQTVNVILNVAVICGLVICIILAGVVMDESHTTALLLADTLQLAQELRTSSDDLTRFVRTYAVTGNISYWEYYLHILDIRNGVEPLPEQPWRVWWDLYVADGKWPRGFLKPAAILDRMRAAGFTDHEMDLLTEAKRQSDDLVDLETVAYNAMNGRYRPSNTTGLTPEQAKNFSVIAPVDQAFATRILHDYDYHFSKGKIMRPIDEFAATANQRVIDHINNNYKLSIITVSMLSTILFLLIVLLLVYFCKVAGDSQTAQLLNTMLPDRVVESVTVDNFRNLKEVASTHIVSMSQRRKKLRELQSGKPAQIAFPVLYSEFLPMAWVAFTDVVNFTAMCRYTPAKVVIAVLNELFSLLDVESINFGVEKIKTIGDAFMCAKLTTSELHKAIDEKTRQKRVSDDGFEIVRFLLKAIRLSRGVVRPKPSMYTQWGDDGDDEESGASSSLQIRVGLHAGPVASGIVGFERPLYDLFGDTVNTAARLESSGRPNRIQIMETVCQYFDSNLQYIEFEQDVCEVELKGIGSSTTRFIKGARLDGTHETSESGSEFRL